jgi:hypothetical protein
LKNGNRASHETIGWVNQKNTARSIRSRAEGEREALHHAGAKM